MNESTKPEKMRNRLGPFSDLLLAGGMLAILMILIVPLPAIILDLGIVINISIGILVLLITLTIRKPLEFNTFPSLLLFTTLYRLALNVASTRMILANGSGGEVIGAFGDFVVGGNLVVGLVVFLILLIIQFVVITKGSNRISEVAARFTLDAMPGKQMAIDADLNAGLLSEEQARKRREEISTEAEFYGAMDGAGKFVRGDAVAGLIITVINLIGGVAIGMSTGLDIGQALSTYALLTVGDGLVSQIPALVIAIAAGLLVTKARSDQRLSRELTRQFLFDRTPLRIAAGMILFMGLVPGLPLFPFAVLASVIWLISLAAGAEQMSEQAKGSADSELPQESTGNDLTTEALNELLRVDRLGIEIGYRLIPLVDDSRRGNLLDHIAMVRKQFAQTFGFVVPPIRMRDNLGLAPNAYRIMASGQVIGEGELYPEHVLAMNPGGVAEAIAGLETTDPTFGMPARWVSVDLKAEAEVMGYTVVDPESVLATHLTELLKDHASEILSREDVQSTLERVKESSPTVVQELVPDVLNVGAIQQVFSGLLRERVPIRNAATILECLADHGRQIKDPDALVELVRQRLSRTLSEVFGTHERRIEALTLAPILEGRLLEALAKNSDALGSTMHQLQEATMTALSKARSRGKDPVLLVRAPLRRQLAELFRQQRPPLPVLSYNEVLGARAVDSVGMIEIEKAAMAALAAAS